ncbi:MAG TPA: GNAT family N-acetyltransferase [Noviherbaspirillum sp.]
MKHTDLMPAIGQAEVEGIMRGPVSMQRHDGISVACYRDEIPSFAQAELTRLYGSEYASLEHMRIYGGASGASTYVERDDKGIVNLLLYRVEGRAAIVLNEMIAVDAALASRFCRTLFDSRQDLDTIAFNAIRRSFDTLSFPHQCIEHSEDIVIPLPATREEYLARFGKATRKNLKQHLNRAERGLPSFRFEVHAGQEIQEQDLRAIVALNHARMALLGKTSYLDEAETMRLLRLVRECGFISLIRVDGKICAGAIYARFGDNFFSQVNAHDPAYDEWRLGILSCYLTICDCIARGGREFHLLWGRLPYKYMLQGVQVDLARLTIYRSRAAMLRHAVPVMRNWAFAAVRTAKYWMLAPEREKQPVVGALVRMLLMLRTLRQLHKRRRPAAAE